MVRTSRSIYYLDPNVQVQDPTYGGLKKVKPEELLEAMVACDEKTMLGKVKHFSVLSS